MGLRSPPTPAQRLEARLRAGARRRARAPGAGTGPGGRPRRGPAPPRCREGSRPAAGGVGEGRAGLRPVGGAQPRPRVRLSARPRGPGCRAETHRKGPDPHLGVLPAARAFAQIRHGARPLPSGGFGSHPEAPVSHLRRAGRRWAWQGAAARPPGWGGGLAGPWADAVRAAAARAPRLGLGWGAALARRLRGVPLTPGPALFIALLRDGGGGGDGQTSHCAGRTSSSSFSSSASARRDPAQGWRGEEGGRRAESGEMGEGWEDGSGRRRPRRGALRSRERRAARYPGRGGAKPGSGRGSRA